MDVEMKQTSRCWRDGVTMPAKDPDLKVNAVQCLPLDARCKASRFEMETKA
jgi:hypothetical protein